MITSSLPIASIIIPTYNAESYVGNAIESVLSQTYTAIECIVVDDGSNDNTCEVVKTFNNVIYIYQENAERSVARNNGLSHATGKYISFLDADDSIAPTKIADQIRFLEDNPDIDAVYSKTLFFTAESAPYSLKRTTASGDILEQLLYGNFITIHAPLFRKSALDAIRGFDPDLSHNEDWELLLRLALAGVHFGFIDTDHALCRLHDGNTSRNEIKMHQSKWEVARRFVTEHLRDLQLKGIATEPILAFHEADFGKALVANGQPEAGRRHIFNACRRSFPNRKKYLSFAILSYFLSTKTCASLGGGVYRSGE